jgi:hypothetical protein
MPREYSQVFFVMLDGQVVDPDYYKEYIRGEEQ